MQPTWPPVPLNSTSSATPYAPLQVRMGEKLLSMSSSLGISWTLAVSDMVASGRKGAGIVDASFPIYAAPRASGAAEYGGALVSSGKVGGFAARRASVHHLTPQWPGFDVHGE